MEQEEAPEHHLKARCRREPPGVLIDYVATEDAEKRLEAAFNIIFDATEREAKHSNEPKAGTQLTLF